MHINYSSILKIQKNNSICVILERDLKYNLTIELKYFKSTISE